MLGYPLANLNETEREEFRHLEEAIKRMEPLVKRRADILNRVLRYEDGVWGRYIAGKWVPEP
jgi:hypothetical protein